MLEIFSRIIATLGLLTHTFFPQILGVTNISETNPYIFTGSGFTCYTYEVCLEHCRYTASYGGTSDGQQCQQDFPEASQPIGPETTNHPPTSTPAPTPTATPVFTYWIEPSSVTITRDQKAEFVMWQGSPGGSSWRIYPQMWNLPNGGGSISYKDGTNMYAIFTPYNFASTSTTTYTIVGKIGTSMASATINVTGSHPSPTPTPSQTPKPSASPTIVPSSSYSVTPGNTSILTGQTQKFTLWQSNSTGTWQVSNAVWTAYPGTSQLNSSGLFTASTVGSYTIKGYIPGNSASYATTTIHVQSSGINTSTETGTSTFSYTQTNGATPQPQQQVTEFSSTSATQEIVPLRATLYPNQATQFTLIQTVNGINSTVNPSLVTWRVVKGGGHISATGLFTASSLIGIFENTIKAEYLGVTSYASVAISSNTPPAQTQATPTNLSAQPTATPTVQPTPQPTPTKLFEYLGQRVDTCLKNKFPFSDYERYFSVSGMHANIEELGDRIELVKECIQLNRIPDLNPDQITCLKNELGTQRFDQLYGTGDEPTPDEQNKISMCSNNPNLVNYQQDQSQNPITTSCLMIKLGKDRLTSIQDGSLQASTEELLQARSCFSLETNLIKPPLVIQTANKDIQCLKNALGEAYFSDTEKGKVKAKKPQIDRANQCRQSTRSPNDVFLPMPPEYVPYVPSSKKLASVEKVESSKTTARRSLEIRGKSLPNTLVDIYIFSTPIVVTTQTDANGNWTYQLAYHLPEGEHTAYTVVRHPEKGMVRSEAFPFGIAYAKSSSEDTMEIMVAQPVESSKLIFYLIVSGATIVLALSLVIMFYIFRTNRALLPLHTEAPTQTGDTPQKSEMSEH